MLKRLIQKFILTDGSNDASVSSIGQLSTKAQLYDPINDRTLELEENSAVPVNVQDQTTRAFSIRINQIIDNTITLASSPMVDAYTVTLTTGHGVVTGDSIAFLEQNGNVQLYFGQVLNVVGDVITMDTPVPFAFTSAGTTVFTYTANMNVDGSVTPQVFNITNFFTVAVDITRVIIHALDSTAMDDSKFAGGTALTRGCVFRKKISASEYINYWNIKTNGNLGELAYDKIYDDKAPAGFYGVTTRLTYGGPSKHGVVIRIEPGEAIELVIQDDLTGIDNFTLTVQGHLTQD